MAGIRRMVVLQQGDAPVWWERLGQGLDQLSPARM